MMLRPYDDYCCARAQTFGAREPHKVRVDQTAANQLAAACAVFTRFDHLHACLTRSACNLDESLAQPVRDLQPARTLGMSYPQSGCDQLATCPRSARVLAGARTQSTRSSMMLSTEFSSFCLAALKPPPM
eukprot:4599421-Pleurochrysis_carterae.AAC.1